MEIISEDIAAFPGFGNDSPYLYILHTTFLGEFRVALTWRYIYI